ncbi:MAG TPA: tripartite tricarboxylate transporter permease [Thermodesulfobacteriota bacterium]|nr:tripartite tricarboxylate transporter permease [Thermodesulfobacteriota bacterium]
MVLEQLAAGFVAALSPGGLAAMLAGLAWGMIGGALPGISGPLAMAVLLPFTFGLDTGIALMLLAGVWTGANYGGSIPAILIRVPGTASSAACIPDGYALTRQGLAAKALGVSLVCGCVGGLLSVLVSMALLIPLGEVVLAFGSPEIFATTVLGLTVISSLSGPSLAKGIASGLFGLLLTTIGLDQIAGVPRFTFGRAELLSGLDVVAVMIGFFGIAEMLYQLAHPQAAPPAADPRVGMAFPTLRELAGLWRATLVGSVVGMIVGIIPGAGGPISSFLAYGEARRWSRRPEAFGKGSLEGVAAPETANNSDQGTALVPTLLFGVPGSPSAAIVLAALILHGVQPGPFLMQKRAELLYAFFAALILVNTVLMLPVGVALQRLCIRAVAVRPPVLTAGVLALSVLGAYALNVTVFDAAVALAFGLLGYGMRRFGFSTPAAVLGMVLGFTMEGEFRRSMVMSLGDPAIFVTRPVAATILALAALALLRPLLGRAAGARRRRRGREAAPGALDPQPEKGGVMQ